MNIFKILSFFSTLVLFLISIFYINHYSEIYSYKNKIKKTQDEVLELEEENKVLESEILFLKNLENLEEEMLKNDFKQIEKEDIYFLED